MQDCVNWLHNIGRALLQAPLMKLRGDCVSTESVKLENIGSLKIIEESITFFSNTIGDLHPY